MLDFTPVRKKELTIGQLAANLTHEDLRRLTDEMIDTILNLIDGCADADVTFKPSDPLANDQAAATAVEVNMPWTLGHVIVHVTASAEEAAALAAELARGVPHRGGRSRSEVLWAGVSTLEQCHRRLAESRRMRLASLDMWPDPPHLDNTYLPPQGGEPINAVGRFVRGLSHDDSHLNHIREIVQQAKAARGQ